MIGLFENSVVLVTGAAAGIGRAAALGFAKEGGKVILADLQSQSGAADDVVKQIQNGGGEARFIACDVSKENEVEDLIAKTVETYGRLDIAYNNAGIEGDQGDAHITHLCSVENWDRVTTVNLRGVWLCMRAEIRQMLSQGGGTIINCSSITGVVGFTGLPAYSAAKAGILGLTRSAALEYAGQNIRINAVVPGVTDTPMVDRVIANGQSSRDELRAGIPMGKTGTPEDIASAVLWLASPGAAFVTGHPLVVDGGWVAR